MNAILAASDDIPAESNTAAGSGSFGHPPHYWTWRVLAAGFSLDECQQIRALERTAVLEHLLAAARGGDHCQLDWILSNECQAQLASLLSNGVPKTLEVLLSRLPRDISPLEAELYWLATNGKLP